MNKNDTVDPLLCQEIPWSANENTIWLASTFSLSRNLEKFNFPAKLDNTRRKQVISLISKELLASDQIVTPKLFKSEDIGPLHKEYLVEHFLSSHDYQQAHSGEAFILDATGEFLATINIKDHFQLLLLDTKGELESVWNRLLKIESTIGRSIIYAFSPKFGFLTSDPTISGTAFTATVFLQLPGLFHSKKIDDVLDKLGDETIAITGIQGNPTEIVGDVLAIQNNYTLGVAEPSAISTLRSFTTKILVEEHKARHEIKHSQNPDIKDMVSRAYGILVHSYQIDAIEALNALSLLKLGIDMGWVSGIDNKSVNVLFFNCRRAHLLCKHQESIAKEEIAHKRSEYIHKSLKNVQLTI